MKSLKSANSFISTHRFFSRAALNVVQAQYLDEQCIEVNRMDEPLGKISKEDCHRNSVLHRAFSVFIFNPHKELLLQQRSSSKITFPNCWTNSCCSHPHFNDSELDTDLGIRRAAQRKLYHELGIEQLDLNKMHIMGRYIYKARYDSVWSEYELDYAIVVPDFEGRINSNPEEVAAWKYVDGETLQKMLRADSQSVQFSPWFLLFSQFDWLNLWWRNLETENLAKIKDLRQIHLLN